MLKDTAFVDITRDLVEVGWSPDRRPSWDEDGGWWYSVPAMDPKAKHIRYKPRIETVCAPLLGPIITPEERKRACEAYVDCMRMVRIFQDTAGMLMLPSYRQYLTQEKDIVFDITLFDVANSIGSEIPPGQIHRPSRLTADQWEYLAEHVPVGSWIKEAFTRRAKGDVEGF